MKIFLTIILLSGFYYAQDADTLKLKDLERKFMIIQTEYVKVDSLISQLKESQLKRAGIMEFIQVEYTETVKAMEQKKVKNADSK